MTSNNLQARSTAVALHTHSLSLSTRYVSENQPVPFFRLTRWIALIPKFFSSISRFTRLVTILQILNLLSNVSIHAQCIPEWLPGDGLRGFDGKVRTAILWDRDGPGGQPPVLVVGGDFTIAGTTFANNIALWNGTSWEALGAGTSGEVFALAARPGGGLVAGGSFVRAGGFFPAGVAANGIAHWDGNTWSPLGTGMSPGSGSTIQALAVFPNGDLVAGGIFTSAGGVAANSIARWNGSAWSPLGGGMGGTTPIVYDLVVHPDGDLFATGAFTSAGGVSAANIARWDGVVWWPLGTGLEGGFGYALTVLPNWNLIAGGSFSSAGGVSVSRVARWNGVSWSAVGIGYEIGLNNTVFKLAAMPNGDIIAGGGFWGAGEPANFVARWIGNSWVPLGSGTDNFVTALLVLPDGNIVAGGLFISAGGVHASHIARWDGSDWKFYGSGFGGVSTGSALNNVIYAFARMPNGDIIAGGAFTAAGTVSAKNIARWNGTSWSSLGSGTNGNVRALAVLPNGDLIAGGRFTTAGGATVNSLARWDGSQWSAVGTGVGGVSTPIVYSLAVLPNGDVVAGGFFTAAGGVSASRIARWNGASWSSLGSGTNGDVRALAVLPNGDLIAGGTFSTAGGVSVNSIARWDGVNWTSLSSGMNDGVNALAVLSNGDLVAGGRFSTAGGVVTSGIARWNGIAWSGFGQGVSSFSIARVNAITVLANGNLIVGGHFDRAGSVDTNNVALWTGVAWVALGSGTSAELSGAISSDVYSLASLADGGFVMGGSFAAVDGRISAYFALWGCPPSPPGSLQFSSSTYSVNEHGGLAAITVTRTGGNNGTVGVTFTSSNGTAQAGSDYVSVNQQVFFADGDTASKTVNIPITNDSTSEGNETVNLTLSNATGGATLGSPNTAVLTIMDDDAPDTIITSGPAADAGGATNSTTAILNFISTDPSATFACSLDGGAFAACNSPKTYTKLKAGAHNFKVQATASGITDSTPASFDWTIDTIAPNTTITSGPPVLTNNPVAAFTFTSTEVGGGFQCSVDGGAFAPCTSPFVSSPLLDGKHNFQVKAVDAAGNLDKSAAKAKAWTVDTIRPITTVTGKPTNPTTSTSATFKFTSEKKSTFQCSVDGGASTACKSGQKYSGLPKGNHTFQVQATDAAGNIELTPASYSWTIQ